MKTVSFFTAGLGKGGKIGVPIKAPKKGAGTGVIGAGGCRGQIVLHHVTCHRVLLSAGVTGQLFVVVILPSVNKSSHGFDGQKCAHTASSPLAIRQVFPAGLFLSGRISAPTKLLAPASDVFSSDFCFLRRRLAGASQGEKGKKHRKDTLSGVVALVNR